MKIKYYQEYSPVLGRDMEFKIYGTTGKPVIGLPCGNGRFYDWENFGMIDNIGHWIRDGRIQVITPDPIDAETVTAHAEAPAGRVALYENWFMYITTELVPRIHEICGTEEKIAVAGIAMGAYHAANLFFRRPDLFNGLIALSGTYDTQPLYGSYMDDTLYMNAPLQSLANLPADHKYIPLFNKSRIAICVGQGDWEDTPLASTRRLQKILQDKGIKAWVDYWGYDSSHHWYWWKQQMNYFLDFILRE